MPVLLPFNEIFRDLSARGRLHTEPTPIRLPGGNTDRRPELARFSWQARAPDGSLLKLTVGTNLGDLLTRHRNAVEACPQLVPPLVFHEQVQGCEVLAERFIAGAPIDTPDGDGTANPKTFRTGLRTVRALLAATERPSTAAARAAEWRRWTARLLASTAFDSTEQSLLAGRILPALLAQLSTERPVTRWTNGDFRTGNILMDTEEHPWLIDCEYGSRTHFFTEDEVRFTVFTPEARHQPDLLPSSAATDVAWHLYFWLRQYLLEVENNTPLYLNRFAPGRKALIRRLAESVLNETLPGWSVAATPVEHVLEDVRWLQHDELVLFVSGWCHIPSSAGIESFFISHSGQPSAQLLPSARPDVQRHFGNAPVTKVGGFSGRISATDPDTAFTVSVTTNEGWLLPFCTFKAADQMGRGPSTGHYSHWARHHDPDPAPPPAPLAASPLISILLPVFNTPPAFLAACLASVREQHYPNWELIVVDDASTNPDVVPTLQSAANEPRVQMLVRGENGGIARATNDALASAKGDFIVLLDHDDRLRPHALAMLAEALAVEPDLDVLYSDEDKISENGRRLFPFLKPAFSPEFLRGVMYPGHMLCVRTALARQVGGFDSSYDGVQDYEFFLRLSEATHRIRHLPAILYHWRQSPGSSALHGNVKGDMDARQLAAVRTHLARIGDPRVAEAAGGHRIRLRAAAGQPYVSIEILQLAPDADPVTALSAAAGKSDSEILLLLSDTPAGNNGDRWQQELAVLARRADSGCVAPVLLSDEERVLESGCTFSGTRLIPLMVNFDPDDDGYNGATLCNREVAAVSPLCVAIRRELVRAHATPPPSTWIEFTERLRAAGYHHRVCTAARVALPRSGADHCHALAVPLGAIDPYYNPAFRREPGDYAFVGRKSEAPSLTKFFAHVDQAPGPVLFDGCLVIRGWCFHSSGAPVRIRAQIAELDWTVPAVQPRPDVAAAHERPDIIRCGFTLHLRLPAGRHDLLLVAQTDGAEPYSLYRQSLRVPLRASWRRSRTSDPAALLACQLLAGPLHAGQPLRPNRLPNPSSDHRHWPRFAIVTPSYQQAPFLEETLQSVLTQEVEGDYIVQDGGSTDGSVAIIESIARRAGEAPEKGGGRREKGLPPAEAGDRHGKPDRASGSDFPPPASRLLSPFSSLPAPAKLRLAWESSPDCGQTDAIAKGFAKTSGAPDDVMAWINSDDFYLPGSLACVADFFSRHPDVDVVHGHRLLVNEQSQKIGRWHLPPHDPEVLRLYDFVPQETLFWRRRIWDRVGGLDTDFQFAMDWDLLLRFQAVGARIVRLPHFLACFRVHASQKTSAQLHATGQDELDALRFRTFGRIPAPEELIHHPRLVAYLRKSARLDLLAKFGIHGRTP